jgi:ubiquinone/menaquinone biosynthesis C-methylase UbiE
MKGNRGQRGFNRLAPVYEGLARAVFGKKLQAAQQTGVNQLPQTGRWLIMGGGTGHSARAMQQAGVGDEIWFLDISDKMVAKAQARIAGHQGIRPQIWHWQVADATQTLPEGPFDGIVLHFFLDLFPESQTRQYLQLLFQELSPKGVLWVADFARPTHGWGKWKAQFLIPVMYAFFRFCCGIKGSRIPPIRQILDSLGYAPTFQSTWSGGMIFSGMWEKRAVRQ